MKGDLTRHTFNRERHYSSVRMQQGRVQLDAEWNEQQDIIAHRAAVEAVDTIGTAGAPKHQAAFGIINPKTLESDAETIKRLTGAKVLPLRAGDLLFSPGRFYVDGTLCEAEDYFSLTNQPDLRDVEVITAAGKYLVYLDVWQRHVTALDDKDIRETALGGPDTTTRAKTVWQVKTAAFEGGNPKCIRKKEDWEKVKPIRFSTGKLVARREPEAKSDKPCILPPTGGYRGLENQLYRVEIHQPGELGTATFKWSRDNGSIVTRLTGIAGAEATVEDLGRDAILGFNNGDWVELIDDSIELKGDPGVMVQIDRIDRAARKVVLKSAPGFTFTKEYNPKMRRWDGTDTVALGTQANDGFLELEAGVQVKFAEMANTKRARYNTGDYWLIPARTAGHVVEWPTQTDAAGKPVPVEQPPLGIDHAYCSLAIIEVKRVGDCPELTVLHDCRQKFPPLTEIEDPEEAHKRHNRFLHGWGVVCGLQVHCNSKGEESVDERRRSVWIEPGYALQCDGSEIILPQPGRSFSVVSAAEKAGLLNNGNGKVVVTIASDAPNEITPGVRKRAAESELSFWKKLLPGRFWADVFKDCLKPLVDFVKGKFLDEDPTDKRIVKAPARRMIASLNLGLELVNPAKASHVFLSEQEHDLLKDLHDGFAEFLQKSSVFCGILDGLPPFPDYPFKKERVLTAFGNAAMPRVRISRSGNVAYAFGQPGVAKICVFDLAKDKGEMTMQINLPLPVGAASLQVQDVAFYEDKKRAPRLLASAVLPNGNSVLYRYEVIREGLEYKPIDPRIVEVPERRVLRVSEMAHDSEYLYALVEHVGLMRFHPENPNVALSGEPLTRFEPAGYWAFAGAAFFGAPTIFAVGAPEAQMPTSQSICAIRLFGDTARIHPWISLDGVCTDGLAVLLSATEGTARQVSARLYVVLAPKTPSQKKQLKVYTLSQKLESPWPSSSLELDTDGDVGLAATADNRFMLVSVADRCRLYWLGPNQNELMTEREMPVQIHPMGLAASGSYVVVANRDSQTLSLIPAGLISEKKSPVMVEGVDAYRASLLALARALVLRLIQKIKDCICEHLLQNCPVCPEDAAIELACVEIRKGKVYHIANCCQRKVITFPKLMYWLSAVPVLPLLSQVVREFCGSVLPDLFTSRQEPEASRTRKRTVANVPTDVLTTLRTRFTKPQLKLVKRKLTTGVGQVGKFLVSAAEVRAKAPFDPKISLRATDVVDATEETARGRLGGGGVLVDQVIDYDQAVAEAPWRHLADLQHDFRPGDRVNLIKKGDKVVMITKARAPVEEGDTVLRLKDHIDRLNTELIQVRESHVARDKELVQLREANIARDKELIQLRESHTARDKELVQLREAHAARDKELVQLRESHSARDKDLADIRANIEKLRPGGGPRPTGLESRTTKKRKKTK